ncbi:MAG TPA: hypothetical protein VFM18_12105 [Methanosarcina sp.]|nr:hypothetical protein [Methanosarcina sp.]
MTQTEQLINFFNAAKKNGVNHIHFMIGGYLGWGSSVISELRSLGYTVERRVGGKSWKMTKETQ